MVWIVREISTLHIHIRGTSVILIMDIVNHSAGLIMSYHMFAAVIRGMVKLCLLSCVQE